MEPKGLVSALQELNQTLQAIRLEVNSLHERIVSIEKCLNLHDKEIHLLKHEFLFKEAAIDQRIKLFLKRQLDY